MANYQRHPMYQRWLRGPEMNEQDADAWIRYVRVGRPYPVIQASVQLLLDEINQLSQEEKTDKDLLKATNLQVILDKLTALIANPNGGKSRKNKLKSRKYRKKTLKRKSN